jgi:hypothetical protein
MVFFPDALDWSGCAAWWYPAEFAEEHKNHKGHSNEHEFR